MTVQEQYAKIVEIVEVIDAKNAEPYLQKHWILLGVLANGSGDESQFIYSLGRPWDAISD